jgi:proteic killer suppression protein
VADRAPSAIASCLPGHLAESPPPRQNRRHRHLLRAPLWERRRSRKLDTVTQRAALRKLTILDVAETLADLVIPPGNRLDKLSGNRGGQHSIRINRQWRICFRWSDAGPEDVEIVDHH